MKKLVIIVILVSLIFLTLFFYKNTNKYKLPKQYKVEIENLIDKKASKTQDEISKIFLEAEEKYLKVINNPKNMDFYMDFATNNYDSYIFSPEFYLYLDLIGITQKYAMLKDENIPPTDSSGELYDFLYPYFQNNNINTKKLDELSEFSESKFKKIEHYYNNAHKIVYTNDNY